MAFSSALLVYILLTAGLPANTLADKISDNENKLVVHFFGSETCGECLTVRKTLLEPLAAKYTGKLDVCIHDIENEHAFQFLVQMENKYNVRESSAEELFFPTPFLPGLMISCVLVSR
ncbi:MAG: hypothetical protein JW863_13245 [Chitinispirillaceae bacterium]|nr:hypothetical protein [Chitinispirillaceae bacterium]